MSNGARSASASAGGTHHDAPRKRGLTPAQWYCLLAGAALLLAGLFGFIADATFDTVNSGVDEEGGNAGGFQGDSFLGFEVNGWHNVVHLLSGIVLLAAFRKAPLARTVALAFGIVYGIVTIIGLIHGEHVLGFIPVNGADNVLHLLLSLAGIVSALLSKPHRHADHTTGTSTSSRTTQSTHGERFDRAGDPSVDTTTDPRDSTTRRRP